MEDKGSSRKPDFLCMGFQKCGTTTLFEILRQHRDVVLCRDVKEPMYYRVPIVWNVARGRYYRWRYYGHIAGDDRRICGEVNAGLTFTGCAKKICHDFSPDTKLIFMMRSPADRSYSSYKYFLARGFLPMDIVDLDRKCGHAKAFDQYVHMVLDDPSREKQIMKKRLRYLVFSQSRYYTCIKEYLDYFPRDHIRLVFFEEFIRDEKSACRELFDFIGIGEDDSLDYSIRANEGNERAVSGRAARGYQILKGFNYGLYEFLAMSHWAPKLYQRFSEYYEGRRECTLEPDPDRSVMLPETRQYLEQYYAGEVLEIEKLAGRSLAGIWYSAKASEQKKGQSSCPEDAA